MARRPKGPSTAQTVHVAYRKPKRALGRDRFGNCVIAKMVGAGRVPHVISVASGEPVFQTQHQGLLPFKTALRVEMALLHFLVFQILRQADIDGLFVVEKTACARGVTIGTDPWRN